PLLTSAWSPRVYRDADDTVIAFASVPMAHLAATATEQAVPSISEAATLALGADPGDTASPVRHAQRRERLLAAIAAAQERHRQRLKSVQEQQARVGDIDRLRTWGELIY